MVSAMVRPAAALWIDRQDGSSIYISNDLIFWSAVFVLAFIIAGLFVSSTFKVNESAAHDLSAADLAQQYDDETAQYRAMSRKLDAESDLAESLIKAKRTRAELDDIEEMFRNNKPHRWR
jgi:flagellar biosynthesis/type III secretory pathway M-ring protein FliF/YscJ